MGKSPGKWFKGILFGKKPSKSNLSKERELSRSASEKPARVSSKEPISTATVNAPLISNPVPGTAVDRIDTSSFDKREGAKLASDGLVSSLSKKDGDKPSNPGLPNVREKIRLEQAATVVQAYFRSYLARRAFRTLKGIIVLQAAVRGHLVRRQAVATLFCVQGIVKFQAITRGYMVRQSRIGNGQCRKQSLVEKDSCETKYSPADTWLKNAFIHELLSSSPTAMPLRIQYDQGEPNSAWSWLHRWSISQVWASNSKLKESGNSKLQTVEIEQTKPKCSGGRVLAAKVQSEPNHGNAETEKLKHIGTKHSSQPVKSAQEHPQFGNDEVKCVLKKIQKRTGKISNEAEIDVDKPKRYPRKISTSPASKFSEQTSNTPTDEPMEGLAKTAEHNDTESSLELPGASSSPNHLTCHLASEEHPKLVSDKSHYILPVDKDFKDAQISSGNHKSSRRTLSAKHDYQDASPDSMTRVPSYMATTASSKAKVKVLVSPRFGQDAGDKNGLTRRHSLPSSINGKLILSPRVHGLVQANGREGIKIDRSLSSSRDVTDKVIHVDWKR